MLELEELKREKEEVADKIHKFTDEIDKLHQLRTRQYKKLQKIQGKIETQVVQTFLKKLPDLKNLEIYSSTEIAINDMELINRLKSYDVIEERHHLEEDKATLRLIRPHQEKCFPDRSSISFHTEEDLYNFIMKYKLDNIKHTDISTKIRRIQEEINSLERRKHLYQNYIEDLQGE